MSTFNEKTQDYTLYACGSPPFKHILYTNLATRVCNALCIYNKDCMQDMCGLCKFDDPWILLKDAFYAGACPDYPSSTQLWKYIFGSDIGFSNYCFDKNGVPIYIQAGVEAAGNATYYVEDWDPTPPRPDQFYLPSECNSCKPTVEGNEEKRSFTQSGFNTRNAIDLLIGRFN